MSGKSYWAGQRPDLFVDADTLISAGYGWPETKQWFNDPAHVHTLRHHFYSMLAFAAFDGRVVLHAGVVVGRPNLEVALWTVDEPTFQRNKARRPPRAGYSTYLDYLDVAAKQSANATAECEYVVRLSETALVHYAERVISDRRPLRPTPSYK